MDAAIRLVAATGFDNPVAFLDIGFHFFDFVAAIYRLCCYLLDLPIEFDSVLLVLGVSSVAYTNLSLRDLKILCSDVHLGTSHLIQKH